MIQLVFGLVLVGLVVTAEAGQPNEEYFVPKLDLLTTRFEHPETNFLPTVQLGASLVFTHSPDTTPIGSGVGSTFKPPSITNSQQEINQPTNSNWQPTNDGDRIYLSRHFRVNFNNRQVNITVKSHSALIEYDGLKIKLDPHSSTIVWSKGF